MNEITTTAPTFEAMMQIAEVLSYNELLPDHLRGVTKNKVFKPFSEVQRKSICFSIVNAAHLWNCNPFMLAEQSYVVHGKLDYSGLFYASLANERGDLDQKLNHKFEGQGEDRKVIVYGRIRGETKMRSAELTLRAGKRQGNAGSWETDPDQMLIYACSRRWVKRHVPHVLMSLVATEHIDDDVPQELLEESNENIVAAYSTRIQTASDRQELAVIAADINGDPRLEADEKRLLVESGRSVYKGLPEPGQLTVDQQFIVDDYERAILLPETQLSNLATEIDADERIPIAERKRLGGLINETAAAMSTGA